MKSLLSHCHSVCKHFYGRNFDSLFMKFCTVRSSLFGGENTVAVLASVSAEFGRSLSVSASVSVHVGGPSFSFGRNWKIRFRWISTLRHNYYVFSSSILACRQNKMLAFWYIEIQIIEMNSDACHAVNIPALWWLYFLFSLIRLWMICNFC